GTPASLNFGHCAGSGVEHAIRRAIAVIGIFMVCSPWLWRDATEVGCVVDAALPRVARHLRIWTERARANDLVVHDATRRHRVRGLALLDPIDHCRHRVVAIRSDAATAVGHAGNHEKPEEL